MKRADPDYEYYEEQEEESEPDEEYDPELDKGEEEAETEVTDFDILCSYITSTGQLSTKEDVYRMFKTLGWEHYKSRVTDNLVSRKHNMQLNLHEVAELMKDIYTTNPPYDNKLFLKAAGIGDVDSDSFKKKFKHFQEVQKHDPMFGMSWSSTSQFLLNFIKNLQSVDAQGRQMRKPWKARKIVQPKSALHDDVTVAPPPAQFAHEKISFEQRKGTDFKNRAKALLDDIEKQARRKYKQNRSLEARLNTKGGLEEYLGDIVAPAFLAHKMDPSTLFYTRRARKGKPGGMGIVSGKYLERKLCLLHQSKQTHVSASVWQRLFKSIQSLPKMKLKLAKPQVPKPSLPMKPPSQKDLRLRNPNQPPGYLQVPPKPKRKSILKPPQARKTVVGKSKWDLPPTAQRYVFAEEHQSFFNRGKDGSDPPALSVINSKEDFKFCAIHFYKTLIKEAVRNEDDVTKHKAVFEQLRDPAVIQPILKKYIKKDWSVFGDVGTYQKYPRQLQVWKNIAQCRSTDLHQFWGEAINDVIELYKQDRIDIPDIITRRNYMASRGHRGTRKRKRVGFEPTLGKVYKSYERRLKVQKVVTKDYEKWDTLWANNRGRVRRAPRVGNILELLQQDDTQELLKEQLKKAQAQINAGDLTEKMAAYSEIFNQYQKINEWLFPGTPNSYSPTTKDWNTLKDKIEPQKLNRVNELLNFVWRTIQISAVNQKILPEKGIRDIVKQIEKHNAAVKKAVKAVSPTPPKKAPPIVQPVPKRKQVVDISSPTPPKKAPPIVQPVPKRKQVVDLSSPTPPKKAPPIVQPVPKPVPSGQDPRLPKPPKKKEKPTARKATPPPLIAQAMKSGEVAVATPLPFSPVTSPRVSPRVSPTGSPISVADSPFSFADSSEPSPVPKKVVSALDSQNTPVVKSSINATLKNATLAVETVIDTPDGSLSSNQQATPVSVASLPAIPVPVRDRATLLANFRATPAKVLQGSQPSSIASPPSPIATQLASSNQQATPVSVASLPAIPVPVLDRSTLLANFRATPAKVILEGSIASPPSPIATQLASPDSDEKVDESMISGVSTSTQQTAESSVMADFYANMRRNMYPEEHLTSLDVQTVASFATFATGLASLQAQVNRPIPTRTIVSLKEIKQKMGKRADLFSTNSMYGFDRERWKTSLQKKFPIDMSAGFKKLIGPNIKTAYDRKLKSITFSFRRKATVSQINSLIGYIESLVPPFNELRIERKRRVWEEIYDVKSIQDLTEYIQRVKNDVARTFMKISWK